MSKQTIKEQLPDWRDLEARIDWQAVAAQVGEVAEGETAPAFSFDQQDARELVYLTAQRWLPLDLMNLKVTLVEQQHLDELVPEFPGQQQNSIIDIEGTLTGFSKAYAPYAGQKFILDWKTTGRSLDTKWSDELKDSWQWRIYAAQREAAIIMYRGLSRKKEFREVPIVVPDGNTQLVQWHLRGVYTQIKALADFPIWPKNRPHGCHTYSQECEFYGPCNNEEGPFELIDTNRPISYSGIERFHTCAERFRRSRLAGAEKGGSEQTEFGSAVHRGLAEIYKQIYNLK